MRRGPAERKAKAARAPTAPSTWSASGAPSGWRRGSTPVNRTPRTQPHVRRLRTHQPSSVQAASQTMANSAALAPGHLESSALGRPGSNPGSGMRPSVKGSSRPHGPRQCCVERVTRARGRLAEPAPTTPLLHSLVGALRSAASSDGACAGTCLRGVRGRSPQCHAQVEEPSVMAASIHASSPWRCRARAGAVLVARLVGIDERWCAAFTARVGRLGVAQMSFRDARCGEPRGAVWRLRLAPRVCCPTGGGCVADLLAPMHPDHVLDPTVRVCKRRTWQPTALTLVPPQWPSASRYARPARRAQQREYRSLETSSPGLMRPRWEEIVAGCLLPAFARHVRPAEAGPCGHRSPPRPRASCSGPLARAPGTTPAPDRSAAGHGRAHLGGAPASAHPAAVGPE